MELETTWLHIDVRPITSRAVAVPSNLVKTKVSIPEGTEYFHLVFALVALHRVEQEAKVKVLNRRRNGQDHGRHRDLGGSAHAA